MSYGAPFCRGVEPLLANLKALLLEADAQGLGDWPAVAQARATYDDISGFVIYAPLIGTDCERHTAEVAAAIKKVTIVLAAIPGANTMVPRPDAVEPEPYGVPTWAKFAVFGVLGLAALHYLTPFVPRRRMAGYRRRSRR